MARSKARKPKKPPRRPHAAASVAQPMTDAEMSQFLTVVSLGDPDAAVTDMIASVRAGEQDGERCPSCLRPLARHGGQAPMCPDGC